MQIVSTGVGGGRQFELNVKTCFLGKKEKEKKENTMNVSAAELAREW